MCRHCSNILMRLSSSSISCRRDESPQLNPLWPWAHVSEYLGAVGVMMPSPDTSVTIPVRAAATTAEIASAAATAT